ncbi:MAG: dTMP kinase [Brevinematales bacterium]
MKGFFITMEGIEGCGKSTQAHYLYEYLSGKGIDTLLTHEPGGTGTGERIRDILLNSRTLSPYSELFLFMADRSQHVEELIIPAISRGAVVICDRYYHSTLAYQSGGRGIDRDTIMSINALAVGTAMPDLTFLIDIEPETGFARKKTAGDSFDRIEKEQLEFHRRVRDSFKEMAARGKGMVIINGENDKEDIGREILGIFNKYYSKAV